MKNDINQNDPSRHLTLREPSPWVCRFAPLIPKGGMVLDLACGGGRHTRHLLGLGFKVTALDLDVTHVGHIPNSLKVIQADLETETPVFSGSGPLAGRRFAGIVVSNYLHRPLLEPLVNALEEGGVLIYETFAVGNERFSRPRNPDHLLKHGELLELVRNRLQVVAYECGVMEKEQPPGVKQRICALKIKRPVVG